MFASVRACPRLLSKLASSSTSSSPPAAFALRARRQSTRPMASAAPAGAPSPPKHLLLNYTYVADILEKRGPHREAHLAGAQRQLEAGRLVCAGAVGLPPKGATFFFKGASREEVERFVQEDAYVKNGLVTAWSIEPYTVVVGDP